MALEVGLHPLRGLTTPANGRYRVDVAAALVDDCDESLHVIEVKGSVADLVREDLGAGKWALPYARMGLNPWLAVADTIGEAHWRQLSGDWGVLQARGEGVRVLRRPSQSVTFDVNQPSDEVTFAYRALAQVQTLQRLPTMAGLSPSQTLRALERGDWHRPWGQWSAPTSAPRRPGSGYEEPGNIL
jgi:hypothetical protein